MLARRAKRRAILLTLCLMFAAGVAAVIGYRTWPRPLVFHRARCLPQVTFKHDRMVVAFPAPELAAQVGEFRDESLAYLYFDHLRSRPQVDSYKVLLSVTERADRPVYRLWLMVNRNLLEAVPYLAGLESRGTIAGYQLQPLSDAQYAARRRQTNLFLSVYTCPVKWKLNDLSDAQLVRSLARYLMFKSETDARVRHRIPPVPAELNLKQAARLAGDIVHVARFYRLPLAAFLGIGAMENNYMSVRGDLDHAVWKRRAQEGDIILERRRGRVLVQDYALGIWQITRETLRYAHQLYLENPSDYSALPAALRPARELDMNVPNPRVLTTYAGLLFRHLLDRFDGNVQLAVGAYNGGVARPNLRYAAGVNLVAASARNFLAHDAALAQTVGAVELAQAGAPQAPGAPVIPAKVEERRPPPSELRSD
jgi:hypothetical protein